jgi:sugar O-acyltransferase (sialic acid O-acetyltransferase NeuD family)
VTRRLIIVGFGGFGREVSAWARDIQDSGAEWTLGGFLDADGDAARRKGYALPHLGDPRSYVPAEGDLFAMAVGNTRLREELADGLLARGGALATLVHPSVIKGPHVVLGEGAIICPRAILTCDITIGRLLLCNLGVTIGHDAVIGDCCTLFAHADVTGNVVLGDHVTMGSHSTVIPGMKVASGTRVAAASVVMSHVIRPMTILGVPGRKMRFED